MGLVYRANRLGARVAALAGGYFWLPCPLCGEYTGGHEWVIEGDQGTIPKGDHSGQGVCPSEGCMAESARITTRYRALRMSGRSVADALSECRVPTPDGEPAPTAHEWYCWLYNTKGAA